MKSIFLLPLVLALLQYNSAIIQTRKESKDTIYIDTTGLTMHKCGVFDCPLKGQLLFRPFKHYPRDEEDELLQRIHFNNPLFSKQRCKDIWNKEKNLYTL